MKFTVVSVGRRNWLARFFSIYHWTIIVKDEGGNHYELKVWDGDRKGDEMVEYLKRDISYHLKELEEKLTLRREPINPLSLVGLTYISDPSFEGFCVKKEVGLK